MTPQLLQIEVGRIDPSPHQPRQYFGEDSLAELTQSIGQNGLLQPLTVRQINGRYELVAGERRLRAVKILNWAKVAALVETMDEGQAHLLTVIENLQRSDLTPLEEANGFLEFRRRGATEESIANKIGKSVPYVQLRLAILDLHPNLQQGIDKGALPVGFVNCLRQVPPSFHFRLADIYARTRRLETVETAAAHLRTLDAANPLFGAGQLPTPKNGISKGNGQKLDRFVKLMEEAAAISWDNNQQAFHEELWQGELGITIRKMELARENLSNLIREARKRFEG